jgi:hypothetical protein
MHRLVHDVVKTYCVLLTVLLGIVGTTNACTEYCTLSPRSYTSRTAVLLALAHTRLPPPFRFLQCLEGNVKSQLGPAYIVSNPPLGQLTIAPHGTARSVSCAPGTFTPPGKTFSGRTICSDGAYTRSVECLGRLQLSGLIQYQYLLFCMFSCGSSSFRLR